ncbi:MAG: hypothetical protein M2R45_02692 [Verrucomicrobia subdivision 3 bacterium]|nr:hypothetical protein [Limisphaerales bacterium]MCS1415034.1 hypothetical protein [Limisphaerales bacterium]
MPEWAYLILGILLGAVIGWLFGQRQRANAANKYLEEERESHRKNLESLGDSLRDSFSTLSFEAFKKIQPEFLERATATVKPLEEHLKIYQQRLGESKSEHDKTFVQIQEHLKQLATQSQTLSDETIHLREILSSNQARGRWGEETLRRVVEAAGMSAHCDFSEQTQQGDGKPDLVVRLPGDRIIVIDAKVPDLERLNEQDANDLGKRKKDLAQKLKGTIKDLANRDYPKQFSMALDYVVLFVPAESLFSSALEGDPDLITWAADKRIVISTPSSLIVFLRAVSMGWQQHAETQNARKIAVAAKELVNRITKFVEHLEDIRNSLVRANKSFDAAVGSYEKRVKPSGNRILELSEIAEKEMPELPPTTAHLREPSTPAKDSKDADGEE